MPKETETRERIRISCEVSKQQAGEVIATLTRMGAEGLGFELITDILRYKNRRSPAESAVAGVPAQEPSRERHDVPHRDFVLRAMAGRASITTAEMVQLFREDGRHPKSVGPLLGLFCKQRLLRRVGVGKYEKGKMFKKPPPLAKLNGAAQEEATANV